MLADLAVDHHVVKRVDVAGRLPDERMHDDRGIEGDDVVAQLDRVAPPRALDVAPLAPRRAGRNPKTR